MISRIRLRPVFAVLAFVLLAAAACASLPAVFPGSDATRPPALVPPSAQTTPTADLQSTSPMTYTTTAQPSEMMTERMSTPTPEPTPAMTTITGQVTYLQRVALQPDAMVEVELQDVSRADAPAIVVGRQRIEAQGKQVPMPFAVEYDLSSINPGSLYSLRARIIEGGRVTWLTANAPRVITGGAPTDQVEIVLQQSPNPQPVTPQAGRLQGVVTYRERIALPTNAVIEVTLQDISRADAPAAVIASQIIEAAGKQAPIPFTLDHDAASINQAMRYAVSARITENGKLTWISTRIYPVLTQGAPSNNVEIVVEPVSAS